MQLFLITLCQVETEDIVEEFGSDSLGEPFVKFLVLRSVEMAEGPL